MEGGRLCIGLKAALAILAPLLFATSTWASDVRVLYSFGNGNDGTLPYVTLISDAAGNLYPTTYIGGMYGVGTAFKLSPNESGAWTEQVLHHFGNGADGLRNQL